jgi:hypothetical protein
MSVNTQHTQNMTKCTNMYVQATGLFCAKHCVNIHASEEPKTSYTRNFCHKFAHILGLRSILSNMVLGARNVEPMVDVVIQ